MDQKKFKSVFLEKIKEINIEINEKEIDKFYNYMKLLLEWNEKINLTAIIEEKDIIEKHFIDSISIIKYINKDANVLDIGTGAGFPGIPIKIVREDLKITLVDSLNKRINFLNEVIKELNLKDINTLHYRAEELGKNNEYREKFDIVAIRAVAKLNILLEYTIPFLKKGGIFICMKGPNINEEIEQAKKAINILGCKLLDIKNLDLFGMKRNILIFKKIKETDKKYPRSSSKIIKSPI